MAIHPDDYTAKGRDPGDDAASGRWKAFLEAEGLEVKIVDVRSPSILDELDDCDGFMWRWAHFGGMGRIAHRLLPVIEREVAIPTYPDQATCWHYDDKAAQALLFKVHEIPTPRTWVFYDRATALSWLSEQQFPLVMKLATGAGSENVVLLKSLDEALRAVLHIFENYVLKLKQPPKLGWVGRVKALGRQVFLGRKPLWRDTGYEPQAGYAYFQEFLPDNEFDTRITIIGNRAFGFRRWNKVGDFRASGSGRIDYDASRIDERFIRLAFLTAQRLRMQSCAIDGLLRENQPVVGEVSYTFMARAIYDCPGHWELVGEPESGNLLWKEGHMWPEEAQIKDFVVRLRGENK